MQNDDQQSVSRWIEKIQLGDEDAAQKIWNRYFDRLLCVAQKNLATVPKRRFDEEDIAVQVFQSFFKGAAERRFPRLESRDDLWQVLLMLAQRKAMKELQREQAQKRGGGKTRGESVFGDDQEAPFEREVSEEIPPGFVPALMDELAAAMTKLDDPTLEHVAKLKLEGYENAEIAKRLGCHSRTIDRKLRLIRKIWQPAD